MYNIALAFAIAISSFTTLGSKILVTIMPISALRTLPDYLQLGLNVTVNYVIPSLVIYLLLRAFRANRFLKGSTGIHALLAVVNVQRLLYSGLLMVASTIEGGGASFVIMTLGAKINPFFHIALLIGLLWLGFNSIFSYNTRDTKYKPMPPLLKSISGKTAIVCLISAIVFLSTVYAINRERFLIAKEKQRIQEIALRASEKRFHELCKENKAEIYQRIDTPKSIYIGTPNTNYFEVLKYMDYVEVKLADNKIYRFTKKEESKNKDYLNRDDVIKEQITEITSRYHLIESTIRTEENTKHGLFVQTVTLIDTKTNNKLAFYSGVWSVDLKKICPDSYYYNLDTSAIKYVFSISEKADSFIIYQSE